MYQSIQKSNEHHSFHHKKLKPTIHCGSKLETHNARLSLQGINNSAHELQLLPRLFPYHFQSKFRCQLAQTQTLPTGRTVSPSFLAARPQALAWIARFGGASMPIAQWWPPKIAATKLPSFRTPLSNCSFRRIYPNLALWSLFPNMILWSSSFFSRIQTHCIQK